MRRSLVLLIAVMLGITSFSQSVTIHFKDGGTEKHKMGLIESIEFTDDDEFETSASIYLERAGMLSSKISKSHASELLKLKISGHMDARDFDFIKWDCMKVEEVDLSDVVIDGYSGVEGTEEGNNKTYQANEIPSGAFFYWINSHKYNYDSMPIDEGMASLKKIVLPPSITRICRNAFARAYNLVEINIPEGVKKIDYVAFAICQSLKEITLPSTLDEVGKQAFADMTSLEKMTVLATVPPTALDNSFQGIVNKATLYVPKGSKSLYEKAIGWQEFGKIVETESSTTSGGSDDDKVYNDKASIVGIWECTQYDYQTDFPEVLKDTNDNRIGEKIYFNADGTYSTSEETGRWTLKESTLTVVEENKIPVDYKIEKLTSTELELSVDIKLFKVIYKFKKVS